VNNVITHDVISVDMASVIVDRISTFDYLYDSLRPIIKYK